MRSRRNDRFGKRMHLVEIARQLAPTLFDQTSNVDIEHLRPNPIEKASRLLDVVQHASEDLQVP